MRWRPGWSGFIEVLITQQYERGFYTLREAAYLHKLFGGFRIVFSGGSQCDRHGYHFVPMYVGVLGII